MLLDCSLLLVPVPHHQSNSDQSNFRPHPKLHSIDFLGEESYNVRLKLIRIWIVEVVRLVA